MVPRRSNVGEGVSHILYIKHIPLMVSNLRGSMVKICLFTMRNWQIILIMVGCYHISGRFKANY